MRRGLRTAIFYQANSGGVREPSVGSSRTQEAAKKPKKKRKKRQRASKAYPCSEHDPTYVAMTDEDKELEAKTRDFLKKNEWKLHSKKKPANKKKRSFVFADSKAAKAFFRANREHFPFHEELNTTHEFHVSRWKGKHT